jgi:hypothetical protein
MSQPKRSLKKVTNVDYWLVGHKKSKSYLNGNEVFRDQTLHNNNANLGYLSNIASNMAEHMNTLEKSFIKNSINKSYERVLADTIEAQNSSSGGFHHQ